MATKIRPSTQVVKETLGNGITLITEAMPQVRSVAVGVWLKRGSRHEPEDRHGICHFIEHMVFKGTKTRSAEQIASQVDSIGGHMDAFTAKEYAAFHLKVLDQHLPTAVEILGDIVLNPLFDAGEMTKEKKVIFEEMGMVEDTPDDLVVEMFTQAFWPAHPLGRPILGTRQSVGRFTRDQLARFFRDTYRPSNLLVAAAGHLDHRSLARLIERHFGGLPRSAQRRNGGPPESRRPLVTRSKKELEQVHLCLGAPSYSQVHRDRYASYIMNTVLGGSMSSRLFQNIREKRGLVYSISSGAAAYADAGLLSIYAGTGLDVLDQVLRLTVEEIKRLKGELVPAEELRRAKDHLKGSLMLSLESSGSRMSHLARQEIYFGRQFSLDDIMAGVERVEDEDVRRVANELFQDRLAMSLLGNLKGYRPKPSLLRV
ncbi:MAG TPA: pitrilysin family protein [Vicinamibacteria bacterium]|nr:pitrilysin family protein [Vicinamibacteria bacterium]